MTVDAENHLQTELGLMSKPCPYPASQYLQLILAIPAEYAAARYLKITVLGPSLSNDGCERLLAARY
jgi:hypothetical protein